MVQKFKTMDGNEAAAYVSYAFTEVATIYPITPSSPMPEHVDTWAANGMKNLFGKPVKVVEMQSEAGAAGAVHGALSAGSLTTTYTASQGLLLMIPNMFKIAGEQLPGVFHVAARAVASQALSIYGDHSDINAARMTGFAFLCSSSVQEAMDLGAVAHLAAIEGSLPFCHFFDGFRTSHEIDKIQVWDFEDLRDMINLDKVKEFRARSLNPNRPKTYGTAQSPDVFFQNVEASNSYYTDIIPVVEKYMAKVSEKTGRSYHLFDYYGDPQAEHVVVLMGSVAGAMQEVVDHLREKEGKKVGVVVVRLYRPFSAKHLLAAIPETATRITVLDRTKEKGALGEPLLMDVQSAFYSSERHPLIVGGRYGLGSKDTTPTHLLAVFRNMEKDEPKNHFTIGIEDDVTHLSLDQSETLYIAEEGTKRCKFWGFGSDGTVGANKQAIKIIGDNTDMYAQGYFDYDSKKSGGLTVSHLRFGKLPIRSTYLLDEADFISCSKQAYVHQYDLLRGLKKGGTFLLNCTWTPEELDEHLPGQMKRALAEKNIEFYLINATGIAQELGLGSRTNMIMQSAFFELSKVLPIEEAVAHLKDSIVKAYGHKGDDVVQMNYNAVDRGISALQKVEVPAEWANAKDDVVDLTGAPEFFTKVVSKMLRHEGDDLPVSAFADRPDGHWDNGTTAYEKRGIAVFNPEWQIENCIQCNQCSYVCPHAAIRPFLLNEEEAANAPEGFETKKAIGKGLEGLSFRIQVSQLDCTGCGNCADVCPAKEKALIMKPFEEQYEQQKGFWTYANEKVGYKEDLMDVNTVKGTQFK
ncbi:MAG: pyruvate:ferredoxin (flavodoxin) oxidoreductase, partial [Peptoniphilaceae bacterium]|nr:pyruvate:ferredoxin (flavodoxin) oxidoreductase [Peptoniphilaceae bacterium]